MSLEVIRTFNKLKPTDMPIDLLVLKQTMNYLMKDVFPEEFYAYLLGAKQTDIAKYYNIHENTVTNRMRKYLSVYSPEFYNKDTLDLDELLNFINKLKTLNEQRQILEDEDNEFIPVSSYKEVI